ncbi:MAG: hypothetical protein L3J59_14365 [Methylococcaceae bacterium]|nr:hypothetical protein [Methylococcaceae bacterium]
MKILVLLALLVNIIFFLWECNSENSLSSNYQTDPNAPKQILLQSEVPKEKEKKSVTNTKKKGDKKLSPVLASKTSTNKTTAGQNDTKLKTKTANTEIKDKKLNIKIDDAQLNKKAEDAEINAKKEPLKEVYCFQVGPFKSENAFKKWTEMNSIDPAFTKPFNKEIEIFRHYMVYYPNAESVENSIENMKRIKELKIADAWLFNSGEYKGGISLGLYDKKEPAQRLVEKYAKEKIESKIIPIYETKTVLYADISTIDKNFKNVVSLSENQIIVSCENILKAL